MAPVAISVVHRTRASIHPLSADPGSRRLQTSQTYDSIKAYGPPPRLPNKPPLDS
jgi:hypothetical protein